MALDRRSPLPLWAQLRDDIQRRTREGEFAQRFPSEMELVEEVVRKQNGVRLKFFV